MFFSHWKHPKTFMFWKYWIKSSSNVCLQERVDCHFKNRRFLLQNFAQWKIELSIARTITGPLKWQSTLSCKQTLELDLIKNFQNIKVFARFQWLKNIFLGKFLDIWNFACLKKQIVKKELGKRCGSRRYQRITCITSFQNTSKNPLSKDYTHFYESMFRCLFYVQGAKV